MDPGNYILSFLPDKKMRPGSYLILIFLLLWLLPSVVLSREPLVHFEIIQERDSYEPGNTYPIKIKLKIPDSWYIHSYEKESEGLISTRIEFHEADGISIKNLRFPSPISVKFPYFNRSLGLYSGEITVHGELEIREGTPPGVHVIEGKLIYQACRTDSCIPPESVPIRFKIEVKGAGTITEKKGIKGAGEDTGTAPKGWGIILSLSGIFLAGLGLNLTPCIYPLIPVTVSYFGIKSGRSRKKIILHGVIYITGIAITNSILGTFVALSGGMLGEWLQRAWVLVGVASVLVLFGLSSLGLWEIRVPSGILSFFSKDYGGYGGTIFMGLTLGVVSAPCIGPFVLGLLTYVGTLGDPLIGFLFFFVLSLGMGIPLAIIGIFSGLMDKMPLSGEWMVWIRRLMGWVLIIMAAHIISPILPLKGGKWVPVAVACIIAGLHLGWIDKSGNTIRSFLIFKRVFSIAVFIAGVSFIVAEFYGFQSRMEWIPYEDRILEQAISNGKPVLLDFYADWCTPCVALEKELFQARDVINSMKGILPLRVDLTARRPDQHKITKRFNVKGVPTIIFIGPDGKEIKDLRITSYVDKSLFLKRLGILKDKLIQNQAK